MQTKLPLAVVCILLLAADHPSDETGKVRREVPSPSEWELVHGVVGTSRASSAGLGFKDGNKVTISIAMPVGDNSEVGIAWPAEYKIDRETGLPVSEDWAFRWVGNQLEVDFLGLKPLPGGGIQLPVRAILKRVK